jgi:signal transduction histidine kinase
MARLRHALWPAGLVLGVAAEWIGQPTLTVLDAAAGWALVFLGLVAWSRRSESRAGPIMAAAGFAWFLGSLWPPAVFLHRGPLVHLLLSYPSGRLASRLEQSAVGTAYAYAVAYPVADNDYATIFFALGLVAVALRRYVLAGGPERLARFASLTAATAFGLVLTLGAAAGVADAGDDRAVLFAYELTVALIAVTLFADLLWGRWAQATVTGLVVDLGDPAAAHTLRDRLAQTLGDPTLAVGYWLPEHGRYVDEAGRPVELATGMERVVTPIEDDGKRVAVLVHDAAVLDDPILISAVASATTLAVLNARLQGEVRARVAEVEASRRRIVESADAQRRRLERELREGGEQRLARVAELLANSGRPLADVRADLEAARAELREFARGIHPAILSTRGLAAAIHELASRSPIPVEVFVTTERFAPAVEAAAYFVCSEALTNVAKYAEASQARVSITVNGRRLRIQVSDDGRGGADPSAGSGLRGLADRVEAFGGSVVIESPPGRGTRLSAELPVLSQGAGSAC